MLRILSIFSLSLLLTPLFAQGEANNWYFGNNAGLTFNTNPPSALINGQLNTLEGCASISDANGNLLFYTDGIKVYNKNHVIMPNGDGLFGNPSSAQSAIIVPKPGDANIYYIVTVPAIIVSIEPNPFDQMCYSEVDITLDGGLGDVIPGTKNTTLFSNSSEKVAVVKHANNIFYWIIGKEFSSATKYFSFLVDCDGIRPQPIVSDIGQLNAVQGYLVSSPDGTKLASANLYQGVELMDFNKNTGIISNLELLNTNDAYGVAFSPNGNFLYTTSAITGSLMQWDLQNSNSSLNIGTISADPTLSHAFTIGGSLQLAPDGKIYVAQLGTNFLGTISSPNILGTGCDFNSNTVSLNGKRCQQGLPPFIQSFITVPVANIIKYNYNCPLNYTEFNIIDDAIIDSVNWHFGDPASQLNFSNSINPQHQFSSPGQYTITLIRFLSCLNDTTTITYLHPEKLKIATSPDEEFCIGGSAKINASANGGIQPYNILWSNNKTAWEQEVNPTQTTDYKVTITDSNKCSASESITITVFQNPIASFSYSPSSPIKEDSTVFFQNTSIAAATSKWNLDDGTIYYDSLQFSHIYKIAGKYCIEIEILSEEDCPDSYRECLDIIPEFSMYIPNSFTPNGDKTNPTFRIVSRGFITMSMSIFDRWGEELIRLEGDQPISTGWDGNYKEKPAPAGTYVYKIEVNDLYGKEHSYFGHINLIR